MEASRNCFDDEVVEDDGELAAFKLFNPNFFDFAPCFDAIAVSSQALKKSERHLKAGEEQREILLEAGGRSGKRKRVRGVTRE